MTLSALPVVTRQCPDCPETRLGAVDDLVMGAHGCTLETRKVAAKSLLPKTWGDRYAFAMVRRGVVIRQRVDSHGRSVAFDAAGPGCVFGIEPEEQAQASTPCGYAATDAMVCLFGRRELDRQLDRAPQLALGLLSLHQMTLTRVERLTQARGASTVHQKVAGLLIALADTISPTRRRSQLPPELTQRDMAQLIGVRHETFCRVLKELDERGAIKRSNDGLRLTDRSMLLAI